ncbi:glucodextranase DOMON-like domain-containing protein [Halapricum hydrolyticum]|uniref:Alpha-amylase family glycosyl hydrolase n=1 Tax=Halapricum hydrolyticum TaxID=2979991 RepID=A0AAE3IA18_9EURY|nr:glucodextranase DOMON-like domain-containing protein [Halapricum hydrolyticum]MCU4717279.1 alpha-amylase family glycosyl hydrolase [Halapricum hydrolyticum]MCU4726206.1 alpha-amylase family glycosyl hydrolase [Halapricum hydrolyticum]
MRRRQYLGSVAGLGALSALPTAEGTVRALSAGVTPESHHPGPPRVMHAGERIVDPPTADYKGDPSPDDRDLLSPRVPDPQRDPDNYDADAFTWTVAETPPDSEIEGFHEDDAEYDYGTDNVVEFDPDVPGRYVLELDAPDGTHELTIRVFPEPSSDAAGPPRVRPTGEYDADADAFVIEANQATAPDSDTAPGDVAVEFLTDDRDVLSDSDLDVDGSTATVPADAVDGTARVHVVAVDDQPSVVETVELDADAQTVTPLNAPPEWLKDATMYEIFTRSFGSEAGEVDFEYLQSRVDYLADLGVDVVWLTPVVDATSHREDDPVGGPHGYDTVDYFETASELGTVEEYEAFIDACHERDIRVCFDLVINHTARRHPFFQDTVDVGEDSKYYDWYERMADGSPANYFSWSDLMNINYQSVAMREHVLSVVDYWAERVDGFRCDVGYGVTHGFWKEVRERVKAIDEDFFLLDETIPYMRRFSESEFDQHFDDVLYQTLVDVGQGLDASNVVDAITERKRSGIPDRTLFLQYLENHDLPRYLNNVGKQAERAAAAATFTLPGTPMIYYGQERALPEYSESRVTDQGFARAFMNWADYDEEHLAFYKSLIAARDEIPALAHDADFRGAYYESDSESVVAYGRDAGDQKVVVVLNFGDDPARVDLRGPVSTTDLRTGDDLGVDDETTTVEVDSVAILETPSLSGLGSHVVGVDDETGDVPYTYPTGDAYADGAFDLTRLDLHESETDYQFRFQFDGPIENPFGYDGGFSVQHLQLYLRDPTDPSGSTATREGIAASLSAPYQYRIVADGEHGARVETPDGEMVAEGSVFASPSTRSIRVDVPKHAVPGDPTDKQLVPLLAGYDPDAPGNVTRVGESAGERRFGGADGEVPHAIDLFTPEGVTAAEVLASDAGIPYLVLTDPFEGELLADWDDPVGDDDGPGTYTYPTGEAFTDGAFDIERFTIGDTGDRLLFVLELAGELTNPFDGGLGFSLQHLQLYVATDGDDPTATAGRTGTNVAFETPYNYRIVATGDENRNVVEDASGTVASEGVEAGGYPSQDAIAVSVPKTAVSGDLDGAAVAPLLFGDDPNSPGGIRPVQPEATESAFGGADGANAPAVLDLLVPDGTDQSTVLESGDAVPLLSLSNFSGTLVHDWSDPTGDDHGPGSYEYPSADVLTPGTFDITDVELYRAGDRYRFVYYLNDEITNQWSGSQGFSLYFMQVYVRDPTADPAAPATTEGRTGTNTEFAQPYHYRVVVSGYDLQAVEAADGSIVAEDVTTAVHPDLQAISFDFPADVIGDAEQLQFAPLLFGYDGFAAGQVRTVQAEPTEWNFGGGSAEGVNSNAIDMITPEGVPQSEAMAFEDGTQLPFVPQLDADGRPTVTVTAPDTVFATAEATLDATGSTDPDGQSLTYNWVQVSGPSVELTEETAADPSFTAPEVSEETTLEFTVTVTDTDGNSAGATTTMTVLPQSENEGPVGEVTLGTDVSEPVPAGTTVELDAGESSDPNGGTLSYAWIQTGGPDVDLASDSGQTTSFTAPSVGDAATVVVEMTVSDGQGAAGTATIGVAIESVQTTTRPTTTESDTETSAGETGTDTVTDTVTETGDGFGPGFGVVSSALGTIGGAAYAIRSLTASDTDADSEK